MAELARGAVTDRPWGRTLATVGLRGLTGQLTLTADRKTYAVAFDRGAVVAARSPVAADATVRIALTAGLVSSSQVAELVRRQLAAPDRDEVELIAELARLGPDQATRLRRRAIAQRAARTFAVEHGAFVIEDRGTLPIVAGAGLDVRAVVFLGARQHASRGRLDAELARFGTRFRLRPDAVAELPQFGFGTEALDREVLGRLGAGAALDELDAIGLDPHTVRAMVYALVTCSACDAVDAPPPRDRPASLAPTHAAAPPSRPSAPPARAGRAAARGSSTPPVSGSRTAARAPSSPPATGSRAAARTPSAPPATAAATAPAAAPSARTRRGSSDPVKAAEVRALIADRARLAGAGDHYALLGVPHAATPAAIRRAYFKLARQLHPDRLAALAVDDDARRAHQVFAAINAAFAVLSDPARRAAYTDILRRGGEAAVRAEQQRAEELALRALAAEQAFTAGEAALRRDQVAAAAAEFARAVELAPDEPEYEAMHAWTRFCLAPDKAAIADATRGALGRAAERAPDAIGPRFYLGRVERMLGHDREALRLFRAVLDLAPHHADAAAEVRALEAKLKR